MVYKGVDQISIHALREEGDGICLWPRVSVGEISIHALREEGDLVILDDILPKAEFLSTPSARRATYTVINEMEVFLYFYPRPPRGGRLVSTPTIKGDSNFYPRPPRGGRRPFSLRDSAGHRISIHALREEGDLRSSTTKAPTGTISIHALREEGDRQPRLAAFTNRISIHALREEGDAVLPLSCTPGADFYPRPPRGGRRLPPLPPGGSSIFLSTPSARRATASFFSKLLLVEISIHALREEGDSKNRDKSSIFKQIIQHSARI